VGCYINQENSKRSNTFSKYLIVRYTHPSGIQVASSKKGRLLARNKPGSPFFAQGAKSNVTSSSSEK
jgi:hypothetical protein